MGKDRQGGGIASISAEFRSAHNPTSAQTEREFLRKFQPISADDVITTTKSKIDELFLSRPATQITEIRRPTIRGYLGLLSEAPLPEATIVAEGQTLYENYLDIIELNARNRERKVYRSKGKITYETRSLMALKIAPPAEDEPEDASFKIIGERGLYVRVMYGEKEVVENGITKTIPDLRWTHYIPDGTEDK